MTLTNQLNIWSSTGVNYISSAGLNSLAQCSGGFQPGDYLLSANFNGILKEMSLVTVSLIDALAAVTTSASVTLQVNNGISKTDLSSAITNILSGLSVNYATTAGYATSSTSAGTVTTNILIDGSPKSINDIFETSGAAKKATESTTTSGSLKISGTSYNLTDIFDTSTNSALAKIAVKSANIMGGTRGAIPYQTATNTTTFVLLESVGSILTAGNNGPVWQAAANVIVGSAANITGGSAGNLLYQSAENITAKLPNGTRGHILNQGASSPEWLDPANLTVGNTTKINNKNFSMEFDPDTGILTIQYYS